MFTRNYDPLEKLKKLPHDYAVPLEDLFKRIFLKKCSEAGLFFKIYPFSTSSELILAVNLLHEKNPQYNPAQCYLSSLDFEIESATGKRIKEKLDFLAETALFFFETYFDIPLEEQRELISDLYVKASHKEEEFYYKFNRDNIDLALQAEELLGNI